MVSSRSHRNLFSTSLPLGVLIGTVVLGACDATNTGNANASCPIGEKRCSCFANDTCNPGLTCISDVCVDSDVTPDTTPDTNPGAGGGSNPTNTTPDANQPGSNGGASQTTPASNGGASQTTPASNGGASQTTPASNATSAVEASGGSSGGENTSSATSNVSTGGMAQTTQNGGTTSNVGAGGTVQTVTTQVVATGGAPQTTSTASTLPANNSPIIDAFASCDERIENNGGRSGKWYYFADGDFNATHGFGDPGTKWADHGCAAWMILGCAGTACAYAGLGFQLAEGNPVDLSNYSGISTAFETGDDVYFVVKTSDGGYFGKWLTGTTGNQTRNVDFDALAAMDNSAVTSLNPRLITEMQFTIGKALAEDAGFGVAIHTVSLR